MKKTNVLIFTEDIIAAYEKCREAYPEGLHAGIAGAFCPEKYNVRGAMTENIRETITPEILADTDVLFWWGHKEHDLVPDDIAAMVTAACGHNGFVGLAQRGQMPRVDRFALSSDSQGRSGAYRTAERGNVRRAF